MSEKRHDDYNRADRGGTHMRKHDHASGKSKYNVNGSVLVNCKVDSERCIIPEGVTEIAQFAVTDTEGVIKEIVLPSTLRRIGSGSFICSNLERLIFSEGLLEICSYAFKNCGKLSELIFPESLVSVGKECFYGCESLERVRFGSNIRAVGDEAFAFCKNLKELHLPGSITEMGRGAFSYCPSLAAVKLLPGIKSVSDEAFAGCSKLESVSFSPDLKYIGRSAFFGTAVKELVFPDTLTRISQNAFSWCEELTYVRITGGKTEIEKDAFSFCEKLTGIDAPSHLLPPIHLIENGVLKEYTGCIGVSEDMIPEGVTEIVKGACPEARSIILPKSLRKIGPDAFSGFDNLESIVIPDGVTEIGKRAFYGCDALRSVVLPDSLLSLGESAFEMCPSLSSVELSPKLTDIPGGLFRECTALENVKLPPHVSCIGSGAFRECTSLREISLPDGSQKIDDSAFEGCVSLRSVKIPGSVKEIEMYAFDRCTSLTHIILPEALAELGIYAFKDCRSLEEIVIPGQLRELKKGIFSGCSGLRRAVIPPATEKISRYAFAECTALANIDCENDINFAAAFFDTPYWKKQHPDHVIAARMPYELAGNRSGSALRDLGYDFFDPDRTYYIRLPDEDGVVEVSSYCGEDGPDEDGFGMETYYDWWYLDERLHAIPGVPVMHAYSAREKSMHEEKFEALRKKAAEEIEKRIGKS